MMFQQGWKNTFNVIKLAFAFATVYSERFFWCNFWWQFFDNLNKSIHPLNKVVNVKYICKTTEVKPNLYISKSWSVAFFVVMFLLSHVNSHITYLFSIISLLFFYSFYLFINFVVYGYIFSNFSPSFLPFHLPTTININITLPFSHHLPFILTILIPILLL